MMITCEFIMSTVSKHLDITKEQLISHSRKRSTSEARAIAMFLMREHTTRSLPEIGELFRKDHTSVVYSVKRVTALRNSSRDMQDKLDLIERELKPHGWLGGIFK